MMYATRQMDDSHLHQTFLGNCLDFYFECVSIASGAWWHPVCDHHNLHSVSLTKWNRFIKPQFSLPDEMEQVHKTPTPRDNLIPQSSLIFLCPASASSWINYEIWESRWKNTKTWDYWFFFREVYFILKSFYFRENREDLWKVTLNVSSTEIADKLP
jgi:hypothetical protein